MLSVALSLFLLLVVANLFMGSIDIPANEVLAILTGGNCANVAWETIILDIRLPQLLTAMLAGAAISVAGLVLQTLFNNPLAGPEVLGVNSGAALGVAVVMLLTGGSLAVIDAVGYVAVLIGAFVGALLVMGIILLLSTLLNNNIYLLIAGVAVGYMTSSAIILLNYFATSEGVQSYMLWGMGTFSSVSMQQLPLFATVVAVLLFVSLLMMKPLNALLLGDAYAHNLGVDVARVRRLALCITGLLSAVVTAYCGPVSFLGLAVPHIARMSVRSNNHNILLPATIFLGASIALACNLLCQLPGEGGFLPLSAVTSLIGAPVIIYVIIKNRLRN